MRITLDTNAIIDLEEKREDAPVLRQLIALHDGKSVVICVSAIAASERDLEGREPNWDRFMTKLRGVGLENAEILNPPWIWDLTFWDHFVFGEEGDTLQPDITEILFPGGIPPNEAHLRGFKSGDGDSWSYKTLNPLCDVLSMWCHIQYRGDVFVSNDGRFHQLTKKPRLLALGARQILRPAAALAFVEQQRPHPAK